MHDCQSCQTPLHGHESFCPVCGLKQYVRPEYQGSILDQYKKSTNPLVLILFALFLGGAIYYAAQYTWIGQLIKRGPVVERQEDTAATQQAAREKLENAIVENLASQSVTGKFTYMSGEKAVDRNFPQSVELTIDVALKQPEKRKSIIEPVKSLMVPAHITTVTLNDARSHATVTYSVAGSAANDPGDASSQ